MLLQIIPGHLRIAAIYYFSARPLSMIAIPQIAGLIDTRSRMSIVRIGLVLQLVSVLIGAGCAKWISPQSR